jgi:outer membrane protein OmpA-like peptidoglycan-associated protein
VKCLAREEISMAGKIDITASVFIALASFTAGHAMAANNTLDTARGAGSFHENTRLMAAGTMLDGHTTLRPAGQPELLMAQAQEPPAAGQPDPELLLKKKHEAEGEKPEPAKPHEEKPAPEAHKPPPEVKEPPPRAPEPQKAPEPPKAPEPKPEAPKPEPKHVEPPAPRAEPAPELQKPKAHEAAPTDMAPAAPPEGKHRAPEAEKPPVEPKPKQEKPTEPPVPAAPKPAMKAAEPPAAKPAPEQAPEAVTPHHKPKDPQPPKAEEAPKAEQAPMPAEMAPAAEKPAEKPVPKPKPPAAAEQEAPAAKPEEKPAAPRGEKPPVVTAPTEPTKTQPAPAEQPAAPNKVAPPPAVAPAGEAPVKPKPANPGQPEAPAGQAAPAPAAAPGTPPPVPPAPAPGDAAKSSTAPAAILPPLNTVQSRDQNQPGQAVQRGQGGKPGQPGQAAQPAQVPEAVRPQFSQEQQQPFTPKELQRLKSLAARPDQSNDTIVLPVDNGAPVLDSDKDANWRRGMTEDQLRRMRKQSAQEWNYAVPTSDEQAQQEYYGNRKRPPIEIESIEQYQGRRLQRAPQFLYPEDVRVGQEFDGDRRVMDYDGQIVVRGDDNRRFEQYGRPVVYEQVDHQRIRETVFKRNGDRIVTLRNRYGQLIQRSRIDADGREVVLFYSPALYEADDSRQVIYRDPGASLPPMRLRVPLNDYIVDVGSQPNRDYYDFIEQPPVEPVERVYTIDEVRNSARIRDKMRRIDLDTITFATGSWDISMNQAGTLKKVADAMAKVLRNNPAETFLIEGHTDAVGSADSNLVLSDRRAQAVADVLTQVYGIAPENMVTQGYGEQFLKVMTYGPEQQNRRVTIRRVTPLVRPLQ